MFEKLGWRTRKQPAREQIPADRPLRCSFCNKDQHDVRKLIAGLTVFICDECVEVCNDIIADDARFAARTEPRNRVDAVEIVPGGNQTRCTLCGMPTLLAEALPIENRWLLCAGCVDAVQVAIAAARGDR